MEQLMELLNEKYPDIDFATEKHLIENSVLDSVEVVSLIAELEDAFDISVTMEYIQPKYFESAEAMWAMIEELS